jgi:hypothetical protein
MRGYYKDNVAGAGGAKPKVSSFDGLPHFPDTYKTPYHKTFSNESRYALPNAPSWKGDRLVDWKGNVVADETSKRPTPTLPGWTPVQAAPPKGWTPVTDPTQVAGAGPLGMPQPAAPTVNMHVPGLLDQIAQEKFANNPGVGQPGGYSEALRPVGNAGRRLVRNVSSMAAHPVDTATSMITGPLHTAADVIDPFGAIPQDPMYQQYLSYLNTARQQGPTQAASDVAGDAATMYLTGKAVEPAFHGVQAELDRFMPPATTGVPAPPPTTGVAAPPVPSPVVNPGENWILNGAQDYVRKTGAPPVSLSRYVLPDFRAREIADAYHQMPHDPANPAVAKAYQALNSEIGNQWDHATKNMGVAFEPWKSEGQPYANSAEMMKDARDNKHLYFFQGGDMPADHPLAADAGDGLSYNDKLRAVHDLFGHAMDGFEFGPRGEENAWQAHSQMFSPDAIPALTTETKGQNSWVNYGPHMRDAAGSLIEKGDPAWLHPADRPYAEQKAGLLPERYFSRLVPGQVMASPNTESLSLEEAIRRSGDPSVQRFIGTARDIEAQHGMSMEHTPAVGIYNGGAEPSVISHSTGPIDPDVLDSVAALRGKLANQDSVLSWKSDEGGPNSWYTVHLPNNSAAEAAALAQRSGYENATISPGSDGTHLHLIDLANDPAARITKEKLDEQFPGSQIDREPGYGDLIYNPEKSPVSGRHRTYDSVLDNYGKGNRVQRNQGGKPSVPNRNASGQQKAVESGASGPQSLAIPPPPARGPAPPLRDQHGIQVVAQHQVPPEVRAWDSNEAQKWLTENPKPGFSVDSEKQESLDPHSLKTTQAWASDHKLKQWQQGGKDIKDMPPIQVVRTPQGDFIVDGVHRATAALRAGQKVPAKVYRLKLSDAPRPQTESGKTLTMPAPPGAWKVVH